MKSLSSEIQIGAPIDLVWKVLTDFANWKDWNPMVTRAEGDAAVGSKLRITMRGPDGKDAMKYEANVITSSAPKSFRWRATAMAGFMLTNDRVFELREEDGRTVFTNREEFKGLMLPLFSGKMSEFVVPMLEEMNKALKAKAEGKS
ncbi:MAG: hypothetical protein A2Z99_16480 [Treponema sp. GWB1_62_6]|nr:MAG: hypothetical protein A2001_10465 [Treponema sp. GWC1_61_84]OHE65611.1 MAG: hypothetical protein A2Y36_06775 [Treponema sp. GWA1_62_8]OHE68898.1 MAG: hypothetical protein A2Z99_16480 [Treponema sp. GWB1_62_6]OHE72682.1 MAG: hypothetical protein A2413_12330 [Treponema sp. RIFOXYC1_FULL_61_9]HCM27745.1 hypothetical protein [Treponema sp.]